MTSSCKLLVRNANSFQTCYFIQIDITTFNSNVGIFFNKTWHSFSNCNGVFSVCGLIKHYLLLQSYNEETFVLLFLSQIITCHVSVIFLSRLFWNNLSSVVYDVYQHLRKQIQCQLHYNYQRNNSNIAKRSQY